MANEEDVLVKLVSMVNEIQETHNEDVSADDALIGDSAVISSRELVEMLLAVEEFAEDELEVEFDWTSDSAMSMKRSPFRNLRVLAKHLVGCKSEAA
ncbi:MAG: hypothetical protein AB8B50_18840 [Pirellulaceae bacterium]